MTKSSETLRGFSNVVIVIRSYRDTVINICKKLKSHYGKNVGNEYIITRVHYNVEFAVVWFGPNMWYIERESLQFAAATRLEKAVCIIYSRPSVTHRLYSPCIYYRLLDATCSTYYTTYNMYYRSSSCTYQVYNCLNKYRSWSVTLGEGVGPKAIIMSYRVGNKNWLHFMIMCTFL